MSRRLTVLAGTGVLVDHLIAAALAAGDEVQVVGLVPQPARAVAVVEAGLEPAAVIAGIRAFESSHVVLAGGISLSDREREQLGGFIGNGRLRQSAGDAVLSAVTEAIERFSGAKVIGAHEIAADLLAEAGSVAGPLLPVEAMETAQLALRAAREIGRLDMGQAAVAAGLRVIAAEDLAGTDSLLARVGSYRAAGLVGDGAGRLVLAKAAKPQQPLHVDMPAIGPGTVQAAAAAGVAAIAVEAGRVLLLERAQLQAEADALGISVLALPAHG